MPNEPTARERARALLLEELADVRAVRGYVLTRGRNAWNSTWTNRFRAWSALHVDLDAAKDEAEAQRKQGSTFRIAEVPAVLLVGERGASLHTDLNSPCPFRGLDEASSARFKAPARCVNARNALGGWAKWKPGAKPANEFLLTRHLEYGDDELGLDVSAGSTFDQHFSFAQGSAYKLGWREAKSIGSAEGVLRVRQWFLDGALQVPEA